MAMMSLRVEPGAAGPTSRSRPEGRSGPRVGAGGEPGTPMRIGDRRAALAWTMERIRLETTAAATAGEEEPVAGLGGALAEAAAGAGEARGAGAADTRRHNIFPLSPPYLKV
jgi:hypothetical protein